MSGDCYYDDDGCLVCPERSYQPYIPARIDERADTGWDGGANSIDALGGDIQVKFTMPATTGTLIGWRSGLQDRFLASTVEQGLLFTRESGLHYVQAVDHGRAIGARVVRALDDAFVLWRNMTFVVALQNGNYMTGYPTRSTGIKRVVTALYRTGDMAPINVLAPAGAPIYPSVMVPATVASNTISGAAVDFTAPERLQSTAWRAWLSAPYVVDSNGYPIDVSCAMAGTSGTVNYMDGDANSAIAFIEGGGSGPLTCAFTYNSAPSATDASYAPRFVELVPINSGGGGGDV